MGKVYVTTYEVIGAGVDTAKQYYADVKAAQSEQWAWVESIGGTGFRPDHNGGVRSVFFDGDLPTGWRRIGASRGKTEAVPNRGTKSGKAAEADMRSLPMAPRSTELAARLGYSPADMALDSERGTIFFATDVQVTHPNERTFVRLPRFANDGFTPDETILRAVAESELMLAIETHNAEAKRLREMKEAA